MNGFAYVVHLFNQGGLVMYPLILCSLLSVAIAVERWNYYHHNWHRDNSLEDRIHKALDEKNWGEAIKVCNQFDTVASRTIKAGLVHASSPNLDTTAVKDAFEERMAVEITGLQKHLDYLSAIVTVAPLLGLFGTVTGMIATFGAMDEGSAAMAISGGIGEALVATATGLCVAVIAFAIYTFYSHQFDNVLMDTENICFFVLEHKRGESA
ncbi:MotA/TolQ/ExbB proton channel family protein [Pectinatus cerevisiiphilus]|uniref:Biopolymer transport protein ExbB n=1 Tax=Pectinatus cerevisiiphilus TaxID=86956 RepID=A0A4R3KAC9_9FIRM|nr:MotA/TolQ/ExbB proton channel family protein [Pectinatus cerevisiiphilus]TCS79601.1 biopolymer transport protein ExbB [Pectinatus cerevisiiphilus]